MSIVRQEDVSGSIRSIDFTKMGEKTTVGLATLVNGFEIVEYSSCVDPAKFDMDIGQEIVMERIHHKIWELLGFKSQDMRAADETEKAKTTGTTPKNTPAQVTDEAFDED